MAKTKARSTDIGLRGALNPILRKEVLDSLLSHTTKLRERGLVPDEEWTAIRRGLVFLVVGEAQLRELLSVGEAA